MVHLAHSYEDGEDGLEKDDVASLLLALKAAEAGEVSAIRYLASDCFTGKRIKKSVECGRKLSTAAAKKGDPTSHFYLGISYLSEKEGQIADGEDMNPTTILMTKHLAHAAKGGQKDAIKTYQQLCKVGVVQEKDYDEVEHAFLKAKASEWSEERENAE